MPLARASWNPCEDRFGAHRSVLSARSRLSTVVPMDTRPRRVMARCRVGTAAKIAAVADGAAQRLLHTVRDEIAVTAAREAGSTALWGSAEAELRFHVQEVLSHRGAWFSAPPHAGPHSLQCLSRALPVLPQWRATLQKQAFVLPCQRRVNPRKPSWD